MDAILLLKDMIKSKDEQEQDTQGNIQESIFKTQTTSFKPQNIPHINDAQNNILKVANQVENNIIKQDNTNKTDTPDEIINIPTEGEPLLFYGNEGIEQRLQGIDIETPLSDRAEKKKLVVSKLPDINLRTYNYLFNDYGLPSEENECAFSLIFSNSFYKLSKERPLPNNYIQQIISDVKLSDLDTQDINRFGLDEAFYPYLYKCFINKDKNLSQEITYENILRFVRLVREMLKDDLMRDKLKNNIALVTGIELDKSFTSLSTDTDTSEEPETTQEPVTTSVYNEPEHPVYKHECYGVGIDYDIPDFLVILREGKGAYYTTYTQPKILPTYEGKVQFIDHVFELHNPKDINDQCIVVTYNDERVVDSITVLVSLYLMAHNELGFYKGMSLEEVQEKFNDIEWYRSLRVNMSLIKKIATLNNKGEV